MQRGKGGANRKRKQGEQDAKEGSGIVAAGAEPEKKKTRSSEEEEETDQTRTLPRTTVTGLWQQRLDRVKEVSVEVYPGLSDIEIDQCEQEYATRFQLDVGNIKLPPMLRQLYRTFNGFNMTGDAWWFQGFNVLPLKANSSRHGSVQQYQLNVCGKLEDLRESTEIDGGDLEASASHARWMPLSITGEFEHYVINIDCGSEYYGQIKEIFRHDGYEREVSGSLEELWQLVDVFAGLLAVQKQIKELGGNEHLADAFVSRCSPAAKKTLEKGLKKLKDELKRLEAKKKKHAKE